MNGRVILIRHGQTAWNRERFVGRADIPLDDTGCAQAARLPALLADERVDVVYCSPLLRARATAQPLAGQRGITPIVLDDLCELDCGTLTGEERSGQTKLSRRDPDDPFPGGESISDAYRRAERVAQLLRDGDPAQGIVVVGHYLINQLVAGALLGSGVRAALAETATRLQPGGAVAIARDTGTLSPAAVGAGR